MTQNEAKPWPAWRVKRFLAIMELKAQGKNDKEAGLALPKPISRSTVNREMNSPQAADLGRRMRSRAGTMIWTLIERQLHQIEGITTSPAQKLIYRGQMINTITSIVPKQVEQKVSGELSQVVKMIDVDEEDLLSVAYPVLQELLRREARPTDEVLTEEDTEEPVD